MIDNNTELGKKYAAFRDMIQKVDSTKIYKNLCDAFDPIKDDDARLSLRNHYRMFVSTFNSFLYYFWLRSLYWYPTTSTSTSANNAVQFCTFWKLITSENCSVSFCNSERLCLFDKYQYITADETSVLKMLASIPPHVPDELDVLLFQFSFEAREKGADCSMGMF